jgi:hypothetical protein
MNPAEGGVQCFFVNFIGRSVTLVRASCGALWAPGKSVADSCAVRHVDRAAEVEARNRQTPPDVGTALDDATRPEHTMSEPGQGSLSSPPALTTADNREKMAEGEHNLLAHRA